MERQINYTICLWEEWSFFFFFLIIDPHLWSAYHMPAEVLVTPQL